MRGSSQLVLLALLTLVKPRTGQLLLSTKKPEQQVLINVHAIHA
jgi:hypothetical protein